jgi:predicted TPR repeat methyltransferase
MLSACRAKGFTQELQICDISKDPLPYSDRRFHHVICCGVLHFLPDLTSIFSEVKRVIQPGGIFAFTLIPLEQQEEDRDFQEQSTGWGIPIYQHTPQYIRNLLVTNSFHLLKEQRILTKGYDKTNYDIQLSVMVTKSHYQTQLS